MNSIKKISLALSLLLLIVIGACTTQVPEEENLNSSDSSSELKKFSSNEELQTYLSAMREENSRSFSSFEGETLSAQTTLDSSPASEERAVADDGGSSESASDFSATNVQVEGVDEADIVKNDGKYIYALSGENIVIVNAYPAKEAEKISEITFEDETISEFFLSNNSLIVFTNSHEREERVSSGSFIPQETNVQYTNVYVYDISDKEEPNLDESYSLSGNYYDARFIDGIVYIISTSHINSYSGHVDTPVIRQEGRIVTQPDIFYFDVPANSYNFHTVAALDVESQELQADTYMLGGHGTLYVSKNNLYFAHQKYSPYTDNIEVFEEVILPLLPRETRQEYEEFAQDSQVTKSQLEQKITSLLENMYNSMSESQKENFIEDIQEDLEEYYIKQEEQRQYTQIHKLSLNNGNIEYETKGEVKGNLLNQFSLDEFDDNLRVATTTSIWNRVQSGRIQHNNVYVLDENLETIGELEELAEDERIYSTRFMDDKLYMVTFREIDPFFVIDLEDPQNPEVLGELKIPGFSSYLHPLDENFIIGIGSDTKESEWGGIVTNGVKLSLFDVSDFENPKEVDNYIIEGRYTSTPVESEHKAFLFDKERELLVLPISQRRDTQDRPGIPSNEYWQGAYVFNTNNKGFELKGTIDHGQSQDRYWNSPKIVKRSLFMDDILYTVSEDKVMINDINTVDKIGEVDLEYSSPHNYGRPIYH